MIRLLGFLIGSAVSIGMLLLLLGIPDVQFSELIIDDADLDSVEETVQAAKTDIESVANEVIEEVKDIVDDLPKTATDKTVEQTPDQGSEQSLAQHTELNLFSEREEPEPAPERTPSNDLQPDNDIASNTTDIAEGEDLRWHSFWNPFRSEIAANGFVNQLEKVTGLDYRVVKIKMGVYEVTFGYANDTERRTKLSQIASATGLALPES